MDLLPIDSILKELLEVYKTQRNFVVLASPGAGKTTRIPPALLKSKLVQNGKKILMLQPRRLAAKAVAARMAEENAWVLGKEVGYQVRFEKCFDNKTQLIVMTEGILNRKLLEDPTLEDVECVILDEFHERSIHSDLAIALLKEIQAAFRPDLRIIVMSATLESQALMAYLPNSQLFNVEGKIFPLTTIYHPKPDRRDFPKRLEEQVYEALSLLLSREDDDSGNILIFLSGVGEIKRSREFLKTKASCKNFEILDLHGSLSLQEQSKVLKASQQRRIILSTNIAETSLTVSGVSSVIDSGWAKVLRWDSARGVDKLESTRISLASAKQRAGRAARLKAGRVYRLWSQDEERSFKAFEDPELQRVDLASTLLTLAAWGMGDFEAFDWFERPSLSRIKVAIENLKNLGALDANQQLTALGKHLQNIPLPPRMALALINAKSVGQQEVVALALALLSEKNLYPHSKKTHSSSDLECDLEGGVQDLMQFSQGAEASRLGLDSFVARRCLKLAEDIQQSVKNFPIDLSPKSIHTKKTLAELLFPAFSDRLCRRREIGTPRSLMVGGRGVILATESDVQQAEFFLALEIMDTGSGKESRVSKASSLSKEQLKTLAKNELRDEVTSSFDIKSFKIQNTRALYFRDLIVEGPFLVSAKESDAGYSYEKITQDLLSKWPDFVARFDELKSFERRLSYVQKYCPELKVDDLPMDVKENIIQAALEHAQTSSIESFDPDTLLGVFCPRDLLKIINTQAPKALLVPSGRHIPLHYLEDLESVKCKVKLQELFGLAKSPSILGSKLEIIFDLLSPAQSPVQTTRDLASFWKNAYPELRAQLKIRYPRHPWPEDPWTAQATHKTKKAMLK